MNTVIFIGKSYGYYYYLPMNPFILTTVSDNIQEAFSLLSIGMLTIFLILGLVVLLGNGLILFANRFLSPEEIQPKVDSPLTSPSFSPSTLSAIVAAVEISTRGTGNITEIKKI